MYKSIVVFPRIFSNNKVFNIYNYYFSMRDIDELVFKVRRFRQKLFDELTKNSLWFWPKSFNLEGKLVDEARDLFQDVSKYWIPNYMYDKDMIKKLKILNKTLLHINHNLKVTPNQISGLAAWVDNF